MNRKLDDETADRIAEERSENEGMPEHPAKARDPARWAADRRTRVHQFEPEHPSDHGRIFGIALMWCVAVLALTSARGAVRWMRQKGAGPGLSR